MTFGCFRQKCVDFQMTTLTPAIHFSKQKIQLDNLPRSQMQRDEKNTVTTIVDHGSVWLPPEVPPLLGEDKHLSSLITNYFVNVRQKWTHQREDNRPVYLMQHIFKFLYGFLKNFCQRKIWLFYRKWVASPSKP